MARFSITILSLALLLVTGCGIERQRPVVQFTMGDPVDSGSRYGSLLTDNSGTVFLSWMLNLDENLNAFQYSKFDGLNWQPSQAVGVRSDYAMDWISHPSITAYNGEPIAAQWLRSLPQYPGQNRIQLSFLQENGRWGEPVSPMHESSIIGSAIVRLQALDSERVLAVWSGLEVPVEPGIATAGYIPSSAGNVTVRPEESGTVSYVAEAVFRSAVVGREGTITQRAVIDPLIATCSAIDLSVGFSAVPSAMPDGSGGEAGMDADGVASGRQMQAGNDAPSPAILVAYRRGIDNRPEEIALARYNAETGSWGSPVTVTNDPAGSGDCLPDGPRTAVMNERIAVAWASQSTDTLQVMLSLSNDNGTTFSEPVRINRGHAIGRADVAFSPGGDIYVSWLEEDEPFANVMLQVIPGADMETVRSDPLVIGYVDPSTTSGYPVMAMSENGVIFAWTQTDPFVRVRNAYVRFDEALPTQNSN